MSTEQVQKQESDGVEFSDVITASRELQGEGVAIRESDISIERKIIPRDDRRVVPYGGRRSSDVNIPDLTRSDVVDSLDSSLSGTMMRNSGTGRILEYEDLTKKTSLTNTGIVKEVDEASYIYPVSISYMVHISPDDPIIQDDYYISANSREEAEKIRSNILNNGDANLKTKNDEIVLETEKEVESNDGAPSWLTGHRFSLAISFVWAVSTLLSVLNGSMLILIAAKSLVTILWLFFGLKEMKDEETTETRYYYVDEYESNYIDAEEVMDEYVDEKTHVRQIEFDVDDNMTIRALTDDLSINWTLSYNGVVPESVVSMMEEDGFTNIEEPVYNIQVIPTEDVVDPEPALVSHSGDWYLNLESAVPVSDSESDHKST